MLGWLRRLFAGDGQAPRGASGHRPDVYQKMRSQALSIEREPAGIPACSPDAPVWGVLMEMGVRNGSAT